MKKARNFLVLGSLALALTACHKDHVHGSGYTTTEVRNVPAFTDVRIEGPIEVDITHGTAQYVAVRTDAAVLGRVHTQVSGNTLILSLDEAHYHDGLRFEATVEMPTIGRLTQNGVSDARLSGFFGLQQLEVSNTGVGELTLYGSANKLLVTQSGVGRLNAQGMTADTCQVGLSGVGAIEVRVNQLLQGYLSGVGSIYYHGNPSVNVIDTGVGNVIQMD